MLCRDLETSKAANAFQPNTATNEIAIKLAPKGSHEGLHDSSKPYTEPHWL